MEKFYFLWDELKSFIKSVCLEFFPLVIIGFFLQFIIYSIPDCNVLGSIIILILLSISTSLIEGRVLYYLSKLCNVSFIKKIGYVALFIIMSRLHSFEFLSFSKILSDPDIQVRQECREFLEFLKVLDPFLDKLPVFLIFFMGGYYFARISSVDAKYIFDDYSDNDKKNE